MPHLILEYSSNLKQDMHDAKALQKAHDALIASNLFTPQYITSRSYEALDFCIGEGGTSDSFIYITIYLFAGRTLEQKQMLSTSVSGTLRAAMMRASSISVNLIDVDREIYRKV